MQPQIAIFSKLVSGSMDRRPLTVGAAASCADVVDRMAAEEASCATIVDTANRPIGILTEQDVARRIAFRVSGETGVGTLMTRPVETIEEDEYLYHAIAIMRRRGRRHMPVVGADGAVTGLLDLHVALAAADDRLMAQIDSLTRESTVEGLRQIKAAQVDLAEGLFDDDVPASEIQSMLSHVNNDIYRRCIDLSLAAMLSDGLGEPPVEFTVIVMGSAGRSESFLYPDQDNGIIVADYPDDRHGEIDGWFIEFADRLCRDLDVIGIPRCKGGVMAINPLWRKTLSQWKEQVGMWSRWRDTAVLRLCDIFFDFRPVWGDGTAAADLRRHVTALAKGNPAFLRQMHEDDVDHEVALGFFGRFITEKKDPAHTGEMNLKHTGTLPLVEAVRLMALREGIESASTIGRLDALHEGQIIYDDEHDYLSGAFHHMCHLLLRQQIAQAKAGDPVSTYIPPDSLSERERDILVDSFKAVRTLRQRIRGEFTAEIF